MFEDEYEHLQRLEPLLAAQGWRVLNTLDEGEWAIVRPDLGMLTRGEAITDVEIVDTLDEFEALINDLLLGFTEALAKDMGVTFFVLNQGEEEDDG